MPEAVSIYATAPSGPRFLFHVWFRLARASCVEIMGPTLRYVAGSNLVDTAVALGRKYDVTIQMRQEVRLPVGTDDGHVEMQWVEQCPVLHLGSHGMVWREDEA